MKTDIEHRAHLQKLVTNFYEKLLADEEFKTIFLEVAQIDVMAHLDVLIDFWESTLFQAGKYKGNLLDLHLEVHFQHPLNDRHFKQWLAYFNQTVDELFEGEQAKAAKDRALSIATIIKMKIDDLERRRNELNN